MNTEKILGTVCGVTGNVANVAKALTIGSTIAAALTKDPEREKKYMREAEAEGLAYLISYTISYTTAAILCYKGGK